MARASEDIGLTGLLTGITAFWSDNFAWGTGKYSPKVMVERQSYKLREGREGELLLEEGSEAQFTVEEAEEDNEIDDTMEKKKNDDEDDEEDYPLMSDKMRPPPPMKYYML